MSNELTSFEHRNVVILRQRTLKFIVLITILLLEVTCWFSSSVEREKTVICMQLVQLIIMRSPNLGMQRKAYHNYMYM